MDQQERVVFSIVPILLLILLLRRARRIRFLLTYKYLDLGTKESAAVSSAKAAKTQTKNSPWLGHIDIGYKFLRP